jgi:hypothetical protein
MRDGQWIRPIDNARLCSTNRNRAVAMRRELYREWKAMAPRIWTKRHFKTVKVEIPND